MPSRQEREVLVVRGRLDRADHFVPLRCGSTFYVRQWPEAEGGPYVVELLDHAGQPVNREPAQARPETRCDPGEPPRYRLTAYIALREGAEAVQLRRGDQVLWRRPVPPEASLSARLARQQVTRQEPARLRLRLSPPEDGAYLQVMYQWGERRFQTAALLPPAEEVEIDLRERPGGKSCRFVVIYSNGLRSAVAATPEFSVPPLGPTVAILHPPPGAVLTTGQPLVLRGQVIDAERPGGTRPLEDLQWLVDDAPAGRGPVGGVDRLPPGEHRVVLRYEARPGAEALATVTVRPAAVPTADEWEPWREWPEHG